MVRTNSGGRRHTCKHLHLTVIVTTMPRSLHAGSKKTSHNEEENSISEKKEKADTYYVYALSQDFLSEETSPIICKKKKKVSAFL